MSTNKLWQTPGSDLHPLVEAFTVGDDYLYDQQLLPYDIQASLAHAEMLFSIEIINEDELEQLKKGLQDILHKWEKGEFLITKHQEDGHTAIEQYLTTYYGEIGKKIHTGRSRNDQSLVMMRLFMKEKLNEIHDGNSKLVRAFRDASCKNTQCPMPGYTHLQKAMPTTVGAWLGSFADALEDFDISLKATIQLIDQNPLGSASGFGIENITLNRTLTTQNLHFHKTQENPLYCSLSRGHFEHIVLQTLSQPMIVASRFACDMLLFTTQEFNFFSLNSYFITGSSIMPQKKNYDVFEIMRGNVKTFHAYQHQIQSIVSSIGSGYQRDLQLTKKPFIEGIHLCVNTFMLLTEIINSLQVHQTNLEKAMTDDLYATNHIYELVREGKSFREAYLEVKAKWQKCI